MDANIDRFTKAFADAWNSLDISPIEHLLADDFHYSSFWVLEEIADQPSLDSWQLCL